MNTRKRKALEAAGFRFGTVAELLELTPEEAELVEVKANLAREVRIQRRERHLSQADLAVRLGSTQPKVSELERGQGSLEAAFRALLYLGLDRRKIGSALGCSTQPRMGGSRRSRKRPTSARASRSS